MVTKMKKNNNQMKQIKLPYTPTNTLSITRVIQGVILITVISIISYLLMRATIIKPTSSPENQSALSELTSITQAEIKSDQSGSTVNIRTKKGVNNDEQNDLMEDIKFATKGDGNIRKVKVDGKNVDPTVIKSAMFNNHDFQPRDESKMYKRQKQYDPTQQLPRSHFRKMTYPLVYEHGVLGTDSIGQSNDVRVNIASTGGRMN